MPKYPVQLSWVDNPEEGYVEFMTAEYYHEDLAHLCSQGLDDVLNIEPFNAIPEDY